MYTKYIFKQATDFQHYTFDIHTVNNLYILTAFIQLTLCINHAVSTRKHHRRIEISY